MTSSSASGSGSSSAAPLNLNHHLPRTTPSLSRPIQLSSNPTAYPHHHHHPPSAPSALHTHHPTGSSSTNFHQYSNYGSSWSSSPPNRPQSVLNNPLYRLPVFASRLQSNRPSHSPTPPHGSHQSLLVPLPQPPALINPPLHLQPEYLDRPDSRSSLQSQSTALPSLSHPPASGSRALKPTNPISYKNFHIWSEEWPRQWGWTGVDIPVHGVKALRDEIEGSSLHNRGSEVDLSHDPPSLDMNTGEESTGLGEVVSCSFASDRWKVEVVKGHARRPSAPSTPTAPAMSNLHPVSSSTSAPSPSNGNLSLYLTCHELEVDWPTSRSISTSILVSIKEPRIPINLNPITDLGSVSEGWIWRVCCEERSFEREREVWECHTFPSLSKLLENTRVAAYDSFIITIQIATPSTVSIPQIPQSSYIPNSLLQGLETLIDDQNTSDIQILVTEYDSPALVESSGHPTPPRYRKRLLFAHSAILKSRSEYFCAMLGNDEQDGWAESGRGENRKLGLIKIEDFDFNCVYWLLRWLYSNRIFFVDHEDVRAECYLGSTLTQAAYPSTLLTASAPSWGWQTYTETSDNEDQAGEGDSVAETTGSDQTHDVLETVSESGILANSLVHGTPRVAIASSASAGSSGRGRSRGGSTAAAATSSSARRRSVAGGPDFLGQSSLGSQSSHGLNSRSTGPSSSSRPSRSRHTSSGDPTNNLASISHLSHNNTLTADSPSRARHAADSVPLIPDAPWLSGEPHAHPVTVNNKASALSIYRLAHRYELNSLQELAMTHLVAHLTPSTAFPLLLASFVFPELHAEIKAYCLGNYYAILQEPEFSRCYAEVGEGLWEHGGEVLLSFTMSLMPGPNLAWY